MALKILVADKLAEEGLAILADPATPSTRRSGSAEEELAAVVARIRCADRPLGGQGHRQGAGQSGQVSQRDRPRRCRGGQHRPEAATAKGILVMNTAEASTLCTAEHALALMMSLPGRSPRPMATSVPGRKMEEAANTRARNWPARRWAWSAWAESGAPSPAGRWRMEMNVIGFDPFFTADGPRRQGEAVSAISTNSSARST